MRIGANGALENGTPTDGGVTTRGAADYIEKLLDDDGRTPGHRHETDERGGEPRELEDDKDNSDNDDIVDDDEGKKIDNDSHDNTDESDDVADDDDDASSDEDEDADDDNDSDLDADDSDEDTEITTLDALAEALDTSVDDLKGQIKHTFKAAGEEHSVTLAELESGYQKNADYVKGKTALGEARKELHTAHKANLTRFEAESKALATAFNTMEQQILNRYQSPDMAALRQSNPAEWQAQMFEGQQQLEALRASRDGASQEYEKFTQENKASFFADEGRKLSEDIPDWNDEKLKGAVETIKGLGFSDSEVVDIVDSRMIKGALELQSLRAEIASLKAEKEKAVKTVKKVKKTVPKTIKAGKKEAATGKRGINRGNVAKLKKRLRQSNKTKDAAALIETML